MRFMQIGPVIHGCKTFKEFVEEFEVGSDDLILTNKVIYEPLLRQLDRLQSDLSGRVRPG